MACFLVPTAEAIVAAVVTRRAGGRPAPAPGAIPLRTKLTWLTTLLWGGAILLALEHIWHGEVTWRFPFLTAVKEGETATLLQELGTVGLGMAVLVTAAWGVMVLVADRVPAIRRALTHQG
jgi:hypothetical protein